MPEKRTVPQQAGHAGHADHVAIESKEPLEADAGTGVLPRRDFQPFLGFDGLAQAVLPGAIRHDTAGEMIHSVADRLVYYR